MPPIDEQGFLGREIDIHRKRIRGKYQSLFDYYKDFNQFLNELKVRIEPKQSDGRGKTIALLFAKASDTFQATYILCENGLLADAEILNRALYESTVNLLYCTVNKGCFKNYIAACPAKIIQTINFAIQKPKEFPNGFVEKGKAELPNFTKMLVDHGKKPDWKPPSIYKRAEKTGVVRLYQTFYHLVSETAHSEAKSLQRYVYLDDKGIFKKILWGPRDEEIDIQLLTAIELMEYVCQGLRRYFREPKMKEIRQFNKRKTEIWKGGEVR